MEIGSGQMRTKRKLLLTGVQGSGTDEDIADMDLVLDIQIWRRTMGCGDPYLETGDDHEQPQTLQSD